VVIPEWGRQRDNATIDKRTTTMRRIALLLPLILILGCGALAAAEPTVRDVNAALTAAWTALGSHGTVPRVTEVAACFPALDHPPSLVCLVRYEHYKADLLPLSVQRSARGFVIVLDSNHESADLEPACPPLEEAQRFLRAARRYQLTVDGFSGGPSGIFTDDRGFLRERKGPLRLACAYTMATEIGRCLVLMYVWRKSGAYVFDADFETSYDE
jgi:hypothetical protein